MMATIPSIDACIPLRVYWMRNENDVLIMQEATGLAFSHNKNIPSFSRSDCSNSRARGKHSHSLLQEKEGGLKNLQEKKRQGGKSRLWTAKLAAQCNTGLDGSGGRTRSRWLRETWLTDMQMAQEFRQSEGEVERAWEFWGLVLLMV